MKKYKYNIGDLVKVMGKSYVDYDEYGNRDIYTFTLKEPMIGKVCGMRRQFLGNYVEQSSRSYSYYHDDTIEQPYLNVEGSALFYEVKQGMLNKPVLALEENIILIERYYFALFSQLPFVHSRAVKLTEKERKELSEYSKCFPRDSKGRFC